MWELQPALTSQTPTLALFFRHLRLRIDHLPLHQLFRFSPQASSPYTERDLIPKRDEASYCSVNRYLRASCISNSTTPLARKHHFIRLSHHYINDILLFLCVSLAVATQELIYTSSSIDKFCLTRKERVTRVGDFHLYEGIGYSIYINSLFCVDRRLSDEDFIVGHVFENYKAVVIGVNTFFHCY